MVDVERWHEWDSDYVTMRLDGARELLEFSLTLDRPWNSDRIHDIQRDLVNVCVWSLVGSGGVVGEEVWSML
ncbi:hypothetical protein ACLQ3C_21645, partial [Gordonia sp. DT30]